MRAVAIALVLALGAAVVAMVYPGVREWWEVGRCIDGGGRWDYQSNTCIAPLR